MRHDWYQRAAKADVEKGDGEKSPLIAAASLGRCAAIKALIPGRLLSFIENDRFCALNNFNQLNSFRCRKSRGHLNPGSRWSGCQCLGHGRHQVHSADPCLGEWSHGCSPYPPTRTGRRWVQADHKADPNLGSNRPEGKQDTALLMAAEWGCHRSWVHPEGRNSGGKTDCVRLLLERKADPNHVWYDQNFQLIFKLVVWLGHCNCKKVKTETSRCSSPGSKVF